MMSVGKTHRENALPVMDGLFREWRYGKAGAHLRINYVVGS
jgi:hypothetical protein